jgi:hypothetical protein
MNNILFYNYIYNLKFKNLKIDVVDFSIVCYIKNKNIETGLKYVLSELKMLCNQSKYLLLCISQRSHGL